MIINQRGSALVTVVAVAIILNITLVALYFATRNTSKASGNRRENVTALNIAEAGKEKLYSEIRNNIHRPLKNGNMTAYSDVAFGNGAYTVSYRSDANADTLWILSRATGGGRPKTIDVMAYVVPTIPIADSGTSTRTRSKPRPTA